MTTNAAMNAACKAIRIPDLGLDDSGLRLGAWLVPSGSPVAAGDRVAEIVTHEVVVDLPAATWGTLVKKLVPEDRPVRTGQVIGWIELREPFSD